MQLFSADPTTFSRNMKKTSSEVAHNRPKLLFFNIANPPKTSPNHMKMSPCATSI